MKKLTFLLIATFSAIFVEAQWWPDVRITSDPYNSYSSLRRSVFACSDTVHVVWCDESMEHPTNHYIRSTDAGLNWDMEAQLTTGEYYDENPTVAASGNIVHVVWYGQFEDQWEIFYLRSADDGATWDDPVRLTFDPERSVFCTLAADGPVLHVVWHDWRHGDPEVYYMRSDDNGSTWGEETRMTNCDGESRFPEVAVSGSFVQIVFQDNKDGNFEIYSFTSMDSGVTWGPETRLTYGNISSEHPDFAINGSESHIVWQDLRSGTYQVYYKLGHDYGATWDDDERLVNTFYNAYYPSLSFSGEWLHVVWYDDRHGNYEIYCKNKYVESTIGIEEMLDVGESYYVYPVPAGSRLIVNSQQSSVVSRQSLVKLSIVDLYGEDA